MLLPEDLAAAFLHETGIELRLRQLLGRAMLIPEDDRLGSFGIIVGTLDDSVPLQFKTRAYGDDVLLVLWDGSEDKKLDAALRRILSGAA